LIDLDKIVSEYLSASWPQHEKERAWYGEQTQTLCEAIERACMSRAPTYNKKPKKSSHQSWINDCILLGAVTALKEFKGEFAQAKSFEEIIIAAKKGADQVRGVGQLCTYDFALRIGCYLKISPDVIYLHAGTRIGAEALLGKLKDSTLNVDALPDAFRKLTPDQAENVLCIYKDVLRGKETFVPGKKSGCGVSKNDAKRPHC
jgi:hypothetical protein